MLPLLFKFCGLIIVIFGSYDWPRIRRPFFSLCGGLKEPCVDEYGIKPQGFSFVTDKLMGLMQLKCNLKKMIITQSNNVLSIG